MSEENWKIVTSPHDSRLREIRRWGSNEIVAIIGSFDASEEQKLQDALLIAAAPQSVRALKRLCDSLGADSLDVLHKHGRETMQAYRAALKALQEVKEGRLIFRVIGGPEDGSVLGTLPDEPSESEIARPLEEREWLIFSERTKDVHVYRYCSDRIAWVHDRVIPEAEARVKCPDFFVEGFIKPSR